MFGKSRDPFSTLIPAAADAERFFLGDSLVRSSNLALSDEGSPDGASGRGGGGAAFDQIMNSLCKGSEVDRFVKNSVDTSSLQITNEPGLEQSRYDDDQGTIVIGEKFAAERVAVRMGHRQIGQHDVIVRPIDLLSCYFPVCCRVAIDATYRSAR